MTRVHTGRWPTRLSAVLDWLVRDTASQPFADNLFGEFCAHLRAEGVPVDRVTMHVRTLHPQFMGARILWRPGMAEPDLLTFEPSALEDPAFLNSPIKALYDGAEGIRQRLDTPFDPEGEAYNIYPDLRGQGYTDYVALPMQFTDGKRHATSWSTKQPGGFTTADLVEINDLLPILAMAIEIRLNRRITKNLLNAYVGEHAGERILSGDVRRGSGATVQAGDLELRPARLHAHLRAVAARRRHHVAERVFRRHGGAGRAARRRDLEVRRRRDARHLPPRHA